MRHDLATSWTLITVTFNSADKLAKYWSHERPENVEWIVVDNNSSDSTIEVAESLGAQVIIMNENKGFSAANNVGLKRASGDYVAFVNPDARVDYSSLDELATVAKESRGIVSPQLVNDDSTLQPNGRGIPRFISKLNNRIEFSRRLSDDYTLYADESETKNTFWLIGAAICAERSVFEELLGWNERYFLYYEDKDICCRAHLAGYPVLLHGNSRWVHGWARETSSFKLRPWLYEARSASTFYSSYPELFLGIINKRNRFATAARKSNTSWTGSPS